MENLYKFFLKLLVLFVLFFTFQPIKTQASSYENTDNPYIKAYLEEKSTINTFNTGEPIVDPVIEDTIIQETLKLYYEEDLKVGTFLVNYLNDNTIEEKVLSLNRENKIFVMHKIIEIYSKITDENEKALLVDYLERYELGVDAPDEKTQDFLSNLISKDEILPEIGPFSAYNGEAAGNWAYNNYNSYNSNYPKFTGSFGTDCTNFVSQALHVGGGKPKSGNWTITKKNSTYWVINSAAQLNHSWTLTDPSPWISVNEFRSYWRPKAAAVHTFSSEYYRVNHKTIYNRNILKGDVVVFHKGIAGIATVPTHLMIISAYDSANKDFKLAGHTNNRQALPLLEARLNYSTIEILEIP